MDEEKIRRIVMEVLRTMDKEPQPKGRILALCCAGILGAHAAAEQLRVIENEGYEITTVFTKNAEELFCVNSKSMPQMPGRVIPGEGVVSLQLLAEIDVVVIPVLTFNTMAKIAAGISDNPVTDLVRTALMQGKAIVAAKEGCDPDNRLFAAIGWAYRQCIRQNLELVKGYGLCLIPARELAQRVRDCFQQGGGRDFAGTDFPGTDFPATEEYTAPLLDAKAARSCGQSILVVKPGVTVTPLARDILQQRGIQLCVQ